MTINIRQTAILRYQEEQKNKEIAKQKAMEEEIARKKHTYKKTLVNILELPEETAREIVYGTEIFTYDNVACFSRDGLTFTVSDDGKSAMVFCQTGTLYADWASFTSLTKLGEILETHTEADPKDYTPITADSVKTRYVLHESVEKECLITGFKRKYKEES